MKMTNLVKKAVLAGAWSIARTAQGKFGGATRDYIGAALKQAWKNAKRQVMLVGKTYPVKETLKAAGFRWDSLDNAWIGTYWVAMLLATNGTISRNMICNMISK